LGANQEGDMPDHDKQVKASQIASEMIQYLQARQKAGGFSQKDIVFLMQKWIQLGMFFEKGGDPAREGVNYFAWAKKNLLEDYKANPRATPQVQSKEDIGHAPKASMQFYKSLSALSNVIYSDNMIQRGYAFNDAEGAFEAMISAYRIKLAADRNAESQFRHLVNNLRHQHAVQ
jgi:hypothetical protein